MLLRPCSAALRLSGALLRRAGIGVGLDFAALFLHDAAEFALHGLESVVDHFGEWGVAAVVHSFFVRDELVAVRGGDIDPDPAPTSLFVLGRRSRSSAR